MVAMVAKRFCKTVAKYLQLESAAGCLLNMHKRRAANDFGRDEVSVVPKWSPIGWRLTAN